MSITTNRTHSMAIYI